MNHGQLLKTNPGYENADYEAYVAEKEQAVADVKGVVSDANQVLKDAKELGAKNLASMYQRVQTKFDDTIHRLAHASEIASGKAIRAAGATDRYVRDNPWKILGMVTAAAFIIGFLFNRRR